MTRRLAAILACAFAAVLFAAPAPAWAVEWKGINVNGVDIVTDEDNVVECGDGTAKYDPKTGVLTLTNAEITKGTGFPTTLCGIESGRDMDLNIVLVGASTMDLPMSATSGDSADPVFGTAGNITISGSGSLTITCTQKGTNAINAYNSVTIDGARIDVHSENTSAAINAQHGGVLIKGGAHVEASGADAYAVSAAQSGTASNQNNVVVSGEGTYLRAENTEELVTIGYPTIFASNDFRVEDGAEVEVAGMAYAANDLSVLSGASLSASNKGGSYAVYAVGEMTVTDAFVSASSVCGYGLAVRENLSIHDGIVDAQSTDYIGLGVTNGGVTIDGGTVSLFSENDVALWVTDVATITGGVVTLNGGSGALAVEALDFGGTDWCQWATSVAGSVTEDAIEPYDPAERSDTYLRIEPVGTTYPLSVVGGKGADSYVAGTQVTVSADAFNAGGHFSCWTVNDPTGAVVLADSTAAKTTLTMPAGAVELTATYEPHVLKRVAAVDPTCTDAGVDEHWKCEKCGALFSDAAGTTLVDADEFTIPATGHSWGEPAWSWDDGYTKFVATFTCSNDPSHTEVLTAEPTASVKTEPTCTEAGVRVYTATVELDGTKYTATSEQAIPALGHDFKDGVCTVCEAKDPDYVAPEVDEPTLPATGDASVLFSLVPALAGASVLTAGVLARRRR